MSARIPALSDALLEKLEDLKNIRLSQSADKLINHSSKSQRQESFMHALVELNKTFEDYLSHVLTLRFGLHAGQSKKVRFKKDRTRLLKQHGIDYEILDGYETANTLLWITQSIIFEEGLVTADLKDVFPFWKVGFPMVQLDNAYNILADDIQIHYQTLIDALLSI